jgi:hypothetical protein
MQPVNGFILRRLSAIVFLILLSRWQILYCQETILDSAFTFKEGTLRTGNALDIISKRTGFNFTYDSRLINPDNMIDMTFIETKLNVILDSILKNDSLVYSVIDKYIIISKPPPLEIRKVDLTPLEGSGAISGIIIDEESKEPLPYAAVALKNRGRGTVTNNNGEFSLRITNEYLGDTLSISYLGFVGSEIPVKQAVGKKLTISLRREFISIPEIIIRTQIPLEIITRTINAIPKNYGNSPVMLTSFYREGVMKKKELQSYSEAILRIYKSAYFGLFNDQISVLKSRKIDNADLSDTLAIRLKAGLSTSLELDGIKNPFEFISRDDLNNYTYRISDIVIYDEESAYVVDFEQKQNTDLAMYRGTMYINTEDYALLQVDFEIHPKFLDKMKESFISSPSHGFNTWPASVKYSVSYRKLNDRYFLNHVRGDLLFIVNKKKRLFNSQFNVFFEMAVTEINLNNVTRLEREQLAPIHSVFSKTITDYDSDFWGDQDFLKPEDNLLQAIKNIKVRLQEFTEE